MKNNILQIISICLSVILLAVCIHQGCLIKEYENLLEWELNDLRTDLEIEIISISDRVVSALDEEKRIVVDYSIEPVDINLEEWNLQTDVSVTLKEWYDDTEVTLLAEIEGETLSLPMNRDNGGKFSVKFPLPLDDADYPAFYAQIRNQGKVTKEELDVWVDYTQLLPLCNYGGGWTGPDYEDGVISSQFYMNLAGQSGERPIVIAPVFKIYKNGELVQTLEGLMDHGLSVDGIRAYTVNTEENMWRLECEEGDEFVIRFCCQDEYGLGYDFLFMSGVLEDGKVRPATQLGEAELQLFRPE